MAEPPSRAPAGFLLALGALLAVKAVELALPVNYLTFRPWEALAVHRLTSVLPGPFYPDRRLEMTEGRQDLARYASKAARRRVLFITDRSGYRKREDGDGAWDIVIGGDSFAAGATLSQDEMLDAALERLTGRRVYPLAPDGFPFTLDRDERFVRRPPKVFVFERCETWLSAPPPPAPEASSWEARLARGFLRRHEGLAVLLDRSQKGMLFEFAAARLKRLLHDEPKVVAIPGSEMIFSPDDGSFPEAELEPVLRGLREYDRALRARGIRFIFLPIPTKENVYADLIPGRRRSQALERLIAQARRAGVETVDLMPAFDEARGRGVPLWQDEDTHWAPAGAELAARLLAKELEARR